MDDITARLGLDTSSFDRALKGLSGKLSSIETSWNSAVSNSFSGLAKGFGAAAVLAALNGVFNKIREIKRESETLGVSTDFYQGLRSQFKKSGLEAESMANVLEKLNLKIGEARSGTKEAESLFENHKISLTNLDGTLKSTEQIYGEVTNAIFKAGGAAQQTVMAHEFFGKAGPSALAVLARSWEDVNGAIGKTQKMTADVIDQIEEARKYWEALKKFPTEFAETVVFGIAKLKQLGPALLEARRANLQRPPGERITGSKEFMEEAFSIMARNEAQDRFRRKAAADARLAAEKAVADSEREAKRKEELKTTEKELDKVQEEARVAALKGEEQLTEMIRRRMELRRAIEFENDPVEKRKKELDLEKESLEIVKKRADIQNKSREMQKQIDDLIRHRDKERETTERALTDRSRFTLQELASSPVRFRGRLGEEQIAARQVSRLEAMAEWNRLHGFSDLLDAHRSPPDEIRSQMTNLVDRERFPNREMGEAMNETERHLNELLGLAKAQGIPVKIPNG